MGGRLQIRWSRKAKKRRLLLRTTGVLQFIQLDVGVVYYILSRLDFFFTMQAELHSIRVPVMQQPFSFRQDFLDFFKTSALLLFTIKFRL